MNHSLLGAHFSIAGGLHKAFDHADKYNCTAMQIFTQNSHTWKIRELTENEIETFLLRKEHSGVINITAHTGYLINLAGADAEKRCKSFDAMKAELFRAERLGIKNLVLHPGSHMKTSVTDGIKRLSESINRLFDQTPSDDTTILLETTAGQGNSIGHRLDDIEHTINAIENRARIGICIDTCHVFAAGYDISTETGYKTFIDEIDSRFGLDAVKCIHMNDSKKKAGAKVDRHEHIGMGCIGDMAFKLIMNDAGFTHAPKILETPAELDGADMIAKNLSKLISFID